MATSTIPTPPQLKTTPTPKPKVAPSWNDPDFVAALTFNLAWEGRGYENVSGDSGGPTRDGITWIDGNQWRKEQGLAPLSLAASHACRLNYLTDAVIREIYWRKYFLPLHGAELPDPLDQVLFDCGVNTGISRSVKMLQGVLGVAQDGVFGPKTLAATQNYIKLHGQGPLCFALTTRRAAFYDGLAARRPKDQKFLAGWHNRVNALVGSIKKALLSHSRDGGK